MKTLRKLEVSQLKNGEIKIEIDGFAVIPFPFHYDKERYIINYQENVMKLALILRNALKNNRILKTKNNIIITNIKIERKNKYNCVANNLKTVLEACANSLWLKDNQVFLVRNVSVIKLNRNRVIIQYKKV